jgi:hypothetical protein
MRENSAEESLSVVRKPVALTLIYRAALKGLKALRAIV